MSFLTVQVAQLVEKLPSNQLAREKKYGAPKSREFKLPPQRFTTADRNAKLVRSHFPQVKNTLHKLESCTRRLCVRS